MNDSGAMQAGHYWTHIKDGDNSGWLKYNDTSVIATPFMGLSSTSSYVFFYVATYIFCKTLQEGLTACLIFGCDVPTYKSSPAKKPTVPA